MSDWLDGLTYDEQKRKVELAVKQKRLKFKIKALAAEGAMLKRDEDKEHFLPTKKAYHNHRLYVIRPEQRAALLAYGLIRGVPYRDIEAKHRVEFQEGNGWVENEPDWKRVEALIRKYGNRDLADSLGYWRRQT